MVLDAIVYQKIRDEIDNDPNSVGYAGKTDAEIKDLLNNPTPKTKTVNYNDVAPINRILNGIADTPNVVITGDVTTAKNL